MIFMYKKFNLKVFYRTDEKICTQLIEDVRECFIQNFLSRMNNIEEDYVWIASELIIDKRDVIKVETEEVELETNADMIYFRPYIDQELYIGDVKIGEVRTDVEEFKSDEGGTLDFYGTGDENQKDTNKTLEECLSEITKGTGLKFNVEDGIITGFVFNGDVELNAEEITVSDANFYIGTGGHEMRFTDNSQYKYTDPSTFIGSIKAPTLHADVLLVDNERLIDQINGLKTHIDLLKNEIALLKAEESNYINIWTIVDGEPMLVQKINETDSEEQDNENL